MAPLDNTVSNAVSYDRIPNFESRHLGNARTLTIVLPPGYRSAAEAHTRYKTLYLNDGQDLEALRLAETLERLYAAGALEVFYTPVQMKKSRPGTLLTVIGTPELRRPLSDIIFRETTTIGVRYHEVERDILKREIIAVDTALGQVRFKLAWREGRLVNATPEFEDCAALARAHNMSVKDVQALALQAYGARATAPPTAL